MLGLECVHGRDLELGEEFFEASGVVEPGLVAGELFLGEESGHCLGVHGPGPLDVGAVEGGRVGFASAARLRAAHVAHDDAAREHTVDVASVLVTEELGELKGSISMRACGSLDVSDGGLA